MSQEALPYIANAEKYLLVFIISNVHEFFILEKMISSLKSVTIVLTPVYLLGWNPPYPGISLKLNALLNITHKNPLQFMISVVFTVPNSIRERERICEPAIYYPHETQSTCLLTKSPDLHSFTYKAITDLYLPVSCMSSPYNSFLVLRKHINVL